MHILEIPKEISDSVPIKSGQSLEPGKSYLCPNAFVGQMFLSTWRVIIDGEMWPLRSVIKATPWKAETIPSQPFDWNGKQLWLYRGGGIGDLLMMTPLIRKLISTWPGIDIHVACADSFQCLFDEIGVTTEDIPIEFNGENRYIVSYEDIIEGDPAAERTHISRLFANKVGIEISDDELRPEYRIKTEETEKANSKYPRMTELKRVAVQFLASALYRSYPMIQTLVYELSQKYEVFIFGRPGQMKLAEPIPNVTNLMEDGLGIRESLAVLSTCDACVAPDSALVHASSALDIPCVALYGPFPSELRVSSPKTIALNGKAPCAPCFYHATTVTDFPAGMPCVTAGKCVALDKIPVSAVMDSVEIALRGDSLTITP